MDTTENTNKQGVEALFNKPKGKKEKEIEKKEDNTTETFTFAIPYELSDWMRNYHFSKIIETGNIGLSLKDVVIEAFTLLQKTTKIEVKIRPDEVRKNEKRVGRKRKTK